MLNHLKKIIRKTLKSTLIFTLIFSWVFQIPLGFGIDGWFQFWGFPTTATQTEAAQIQQYTGGLVVYSDGTAGTPKYKVFDDTTGFGAEQSATSVGASAIEWIRVAASPARDEWIIVTRDAGDKIIAQVCTGIDGGVSCGTTTTISAAAGTHGFRNFDIEYEKLSGDALLVYGTSTVNGLRKIEWDGTAWVNDSAITTTRTTGTVEWVELTSSPINNQIGIAYSDTNDDVSAYRWDGTAVADEATAVITASAVAENVRKFDVSFEGLSGEMIVVAPISAAGTIAYGTLVGTTWTITTETGVDNITAYIDLQEPGPDNDIAMVAHDTAASNNPTEGYEWSGAGIVDGSVLVDTSSTVWGANYQYTSTAYVSTTYYAAGVFSDVTGPDDINWYTMDSAGTWTLQADNLRTRGTTRFAKLFDYPNANKVLLLSSDSGSDLWADTWSGGTPSATIWANLTSGGALETALSSATTEVFDFSFRLSPIIGTPIFYNSGGTEQLAFNNSRQSTTTPIFRVSATSTVSLNAFQLELNSLSNFTGTAYTQTFPGTYASGTQYNLYATNTSPSLPTTNGVTYYARARASANGGVSYGSWSSEIWSFTYRSSGVTGWFQTTDEQFNTDTRVNTILNGSGDVTLLSLSATGGATSTFSGYTKHVFTSDGTFSITGGSGLVRTLVVAGGGGGGSGGQTGGGGGGAGGLNSSSSYFVSAGSYTVTVGAGGAGGIRSISPQYGLRGGTSTFDTISTTGGGGGLYSAEGSATTSSGGSGGGGSGYSSNNTGGIAISGQGYNGGNGVYTTNTNFGGGGGGGAGAVGSNGVAAAGGNGGAGLNFSSIYGTAVGASGWFAGGGGGAGYTTQGTASAGGAAGRTGALGYSATANTGGGGGGATAGFGGGAGGSGIVIVDYLTPTATGSLMSTPVSYSSFIGSSAWGEFLWTEDETYGSISMQAYYGTNCSTIVPDAALAGNSTGFATSPIDISGLSTSTYSNICIKATLTNSGGAPILSDWSVNTWDGIPGVPTLYNDDSGVNQIAFNNAKQNDTTPIVRVSASSPGGFNRFKLEFNTSADFTGTSYLETFSSTYLSSTPYNLQTTATLGLPTTDGVTYYIRAAASANAGASYGSWSTNVWAYTYNNTLADAFWHQTTGSQFERGVVSYLMATTSSVLLQNESLTPTVDNFTKNAVFSSFSVDLTKPTGVNVGDLLLIIVANGNSSNAASWDNATYKPSGFTFIPKIAGDPDAAANAGAFYRIADGTEMAATTSPSAVSIHQLGAYILVKNASLTNPIHAIGATTSVAAALTLDIPALTTTIDKTLAFFSMAFDGGDEGAFTVSGTGWTKGDEMTIGSGTGNSGSWGTKTQTSAGSTGIVTIGNTAATSDGYAGFQFAVAPKTINATSGSIMSPQINLSSFKDASSWNEASFTVDETVGDVKLQLYTTITTACDTIIPDGVLTGNSTGFDTTVDISSLSTTTYNDICLNANLSASSGTPYLLDWSVSANLAAGEKNTQTNYRWRNDDGDETTATYAAATSTAITTGVYVGDRIRLRMQLSNTGGQDTLNYQYRLEYASNSDSCNSWTAVPSNASTEAWSMDWSYYVYDNSNTTDSTGIANPSGKTFVAGKIKSAENQTPSITLTPTQFTEIEYSIRPTSNIITGLVYCFRVTNAGSPAKIVYSTQPRITVAPITIYIRGGGTNVDTSSTPGTTNTGGGADGGTNTETSTTTTPTGTTTPPVDGGQGDLGLLNNNFFVAAAFTALVSGEWYDRLVNWIKGIFEKVLKR